METTPFVTASKIYPEINLTRELKDLYNENFKYLKEKEIDEDTTR